MSLSGNILISCGEQFTLINSKKWREILEVGVYENLFFDDQDLNDFITSRIRFSEKHDGFYCGIIKRKIGGIEKFWDCMLFYNNEHLEYQRVAIENAVCTNCDWKGIVANPTVPGLYVSLSNRFDLMNQAARLEQVTCPRCNGKLNRNAIWVGEDKDE